MFVKIKKWIDYKSIHFFCIPGGARTLDPLIKSQLLYQLSYGYLYNAQCTIHNAQFIMHNCELASAKLQFFSDISIKKYYFFQNSSFLTPHS